MTRFLPLALLVAGSAAAAGEAAPSTPPDAHAGGPRRPLPKLPYTPGLDLSAMARAADPCVDFFGRPMAPRAEVCRIW